MCRLLGITHYDYHQHQQLLEDFLELAEKGKTLKDDPAGHADGWGIGYFRNGRPCIHKSGKSLLKEITSYRSLLKKIGNSPVLIVHLRKSAWRETTTAKHAHPFEYRNVILAHNGTIRDYQQLATEIPKPYAASAAALDTEVYLHYVMSRNVTPLHDTFADAVRHLRKDHVYSSLTCLFSDGNDLYAYRDYSRYPRYYTLYHAHSAGSDIVSSEQLTDLKSWRLLTRTKLFVYPGQP